MITNSVETISPVTVYSSLSPVVVPLAVVKAKVDNFTVKQSAVKHSSSFPAPQVATEWAIVTFTSFSLLAS